MPPWELPVRLSRNSRQPGPPQDGRQNLLLRRRSLTKSRLNPRPRLVGGEPHPRLFDGRVEALRRERVPWVRRELGHLALEPALHKRLGAWRDDRSSVVDSLGICSGVVGRIREVQDRLKAESKTHAEEEDGDRDRCKSGGEILKTGNEKEASTALSEPGPKTRFETGPVERRGLLVAVVLEESHGALERLELGRARITLIEVRLKRRLLISPEFAFHELHDSLLKFVAPHLYLRSPSCFLSFRTAWK
jgi:hypothetical protein